jgi:hypothetical protein
LELIKDYDYVIDYHPSKANVVADVLSRKGKAVVDDSGNKEQRGLVELKMMGVRLSVGLKGLLVAQVKI